MIRHAKPAVAVALGLLLAATTCTGQDAKADQIRAVMQSMSRSLVPVEFVIELSIGFQSRRALGSTVGVVASEDGVVIVNNTIFSPGSAGSSGIVSKPSSLSVVLRDGQRRAAAFLGQDGDRGLAFLRISSMKGSGLLPLEFDAAARVSVAEEVIAVGRLPRSHGYAATFMLARINSIQREPIPMYGSSSDLRRMLGCPVATLDGRVIGLVTPSRFQAPDTSRIDMLSATLGTNAGVLPTHAFQHLVKTPPKKKAKKGWLGIEMQALTSDIGKALGVDAKSGIIVSRVFRGKGFAAEKAGIQEEDIITSFDGRRLPPMADAAQTLALFRQIVRDTGPKSQVSVEVLRDNKPIALTLNLSSTPKEPDDAQKVESPQFGMVVREITFMDALGLRIGLETMGVLVAYVQQGSWASLGGLRPNDVIQRIEETRIRTIGDFEKAIRHIEKEKKGGVIPVLVRRGNETVFVRIEPDWR